MLKSYTEWLLKWKYGVVALSLLAVAALGFGAGRLTFNNDYQVFFSADNPHLLAFENLQNTYTKNDNVMFVISPEDGKVFSSSTLEAIRDITEQSWQIPYSIRVDSVTNFQHTRAEGDDLMVSDLVTDTENLSNDDLNDIEQIALHEPMLINRLVAKDSAHAGVNVTIQLPGVDQMKENPEVIAHVRKLRDDMLLKYPGIDIRLVGAAMLNNAFPEASMHDGQTLVPLAFLVTIVMVYLLLRGFSGTFATFIVVAFSIVSAMGVTGWLGIKLTPPSASAPIIILTLAIANAVHILVAVVHEMHKGHSKYESIMESMRINMMPIFLTNLTTVIGFLSMNTSDAPPFRDLGNIAALGIIASFIYSVTFLPAIMAILPIHSRHIVVGTAPMQKLADWIIARRKMLLPAVFLICFILISMIPLNKLNDVFVNYFDESVDFRVDTDYATAHLTGTYNIDYSLDSGAPHNVSNPVFLQQVEAFANWYRQQPEVVHVYAITDTFKRLNKNMHGDDPAWYKLPENNNLAAQYLLLYEMSLPYGLDLNNQIDVAKRHTRLSATLKTISSSEILALEDRAQAWMLKNAPGMRTEGTSPAIMFSHIGMRNIVSMLSGTTLALVTITLVLIISLRSIKYGLITLIPNMLPAAVAFGIWGLIDGEVGLALSIVTAMTLGIVDDDTVHFTSNYLRGRKEKNLSSADAVRYAFRHVGVAIWVTSAVLIAGFLILSLSAFKLNASAGIMTSIIIAVAMLLEFFLLSPLLMFFDQEQPAKSKESHA